MRVEQAGGCPCAKDVVDGGLGVHPACQTGPLSFEHVPEMSDDALDRLLFRPAPPSNAMRPMPNWAQVDRELGHKHVMLDLL